MPFLMSGKYAVHYPHRFCVARSHAAGRRQLEKAFVEPPAKDPAAQGGIRIEVIGEAIAAAALDAFAGEIALPQQPVEWNEMPAAGLEILPDKTRRGACKIGRANGDGGVHGF